MYTALYRAFRPETFEGILGQEHIVKILKNQITTKTTSHAYLFCGTRGTGKTSTARILAKGVNCTAETGNRPCGECDNCKSIKEGTFFDVVEIDAASNNGVDNIRELRESIKYPPAVGACKVYIIDEVHMLSSGAFNALLKTLEEPPGYVMFILATTEPQKLPATILSRCLRLDFKRVPERILRESMKEICGRIGVEISDAAVGLIASNADGSVRDGLSLLDQCISSGAKFVSREDVLELLGTSGEEVFLEMTDFVKTHQVAQALLLLDRILSDGKDVRQFMKDWIAHFRSLLMVKFVKHPEELLNMSIENVERIRRQSEQLDLPVINDSIIELSKTSTDAKWSTQPRILLELCIVRMATGGTSIVTRPAAKVETETEQMSSDGKEQTQGEKLQPMAEKPEKKAKEPDQRDRQGEEQLSQYDYDKIWHKIFEEGETQKGSYNLLRSGSQLKKITTGAFLVETNNEMTLRFVENNRADIEKLMERHTGKNLKLECLLANAGGEDNGDTAEALAEKIGQRLGMNIQVES